MQTIVRLMWVANLFAAPLAAVVLIGGLVEAKGAPQQAAAAAVACAISVIPYCVTRAMQEAVRAP